MKPIVTPDEMHILEKEAIDEGAATIEKLMDIVGQGVCEAVLSYASYATKKPYILILAGKGNNGADGYTAGYNLLSLGFHVFAVQIEKEASLHTEIAKRRELFLKQGGTCFPSFDEVPYVFLEEHPLIIIDAIYGTGMKGPPSQEARRAIQWANNLPYPRISIDVPSGIDPNNGEVCVNAIQADITLACHLPKRGCFFGEGKNHTGTITTIDVGIKEPTSEFVLLEEKDVLPLLPTYSLTQDKFSRGSVVLTGGSSGLMGALGLSSRAGLSSGIGYLQAAIRQDAWEEIECLPLEVVKRKIPENVCAFSSFFFDLIHRASALVIGPGLGRDELAQSIFKELWKYDSCIPKLIDADGLFWLAQEEFVPNCLNNIVITPHRGEAERLIANSLGKHSKNLPYDVLIHKLQTEVLYGSIGSVCVLKGSPTFIFQGGYTKGEGNPVFVMNGGDPGMATLGSGDVLTGIIGAFLAQGLEPIHAAILGTWVHAESGKEAAKKYSSYSVTASRILECIPEVFLKLLKTRTHGTFRNFMPTRGTEPTGIEDYL